jgi:cellulose synthase operon protein C
MSKRILATAAAIAFLLVPLGAGAADKDKENKKAKVQKVTSGGPTLKYEQFRKQVELKVAEKRAEQLKGLQRLLELGPKEKEIPDIKFRIAELYYEESRYFFMRAQEADDKAINAKSPAEKDQFTSEQKARMKESKGWVRRAIDIYKEIRDKYPKYERMPEVLFALGQSFWSEGQYQAAIEVYADLIRNFKDSPLVAEAWIAFGEYYFQEGDVNKALKSYEKAAEDKRSRVYGFALYKQAWCYYNLSDWKKALSKFKATVYYSQLAEQLSGENRIALGREAQKDFVRTYAHVGDPTRAKFEFADLLGKDDCVDQTCLALMEQLAGLWYEAGYFDESASIYTQLIKLKPDNTRNPYFQNRIVDLISKGPDKQRTINESRKLVQLLEQTKAQVEKMTGDKKTIEKAQNDVKEASEEAEGTVRKLAQVWNIEAKKTRQPKTYEFAKSMYADYLKLFPSTKYAYEMRFQLGDIYYKLEMFDDAAREYEATVKADPKGQFLVEAANDNILALEEWLKDLKLPKPKAADKPTEIPKQKMRLIEALDRYVTMVPGDKADKLVAVMFKAGKIYYDYNHFEEALKRFDTIVTNHPSEKEAEFAANLVIDVYNLKQDWRNLYDFSVRYAKIEALVKDREKLQKELDHYGEYAKFKLVQILEEKVNKEGGNLSLVAKAYQEFYEEFPKSENADKALFNASVAWDKVGEKKQANELRQKLLKEYPNSPNSPLGVDVAYYVAKSHEETTDYEVAAKLFADFAEKYATDKRARDALYNAAIFYAGVGEVKIANKLRESYLEKYGKVKEAEKEAAAIYYSSARDLEHAGKWGEAANRYADFVKKFPNAEQIWDALHNEAALRRHKLRQISAAEKIEGQILGTYEARKRKGAPTPPQAALYASLIAFDRVDKDFSEYKRIKIQRMSIRDPKPFIRSLEEKARAREKMVKSYTTIVTKYQQADSSIAALYRIAESWDDFVTQLAKLPCPQGREVTEEVCSLIKQDIEQNKLGPARDAAAAAYKACVTKSNELNVFTAYSTKCVKALEELAPDQFPPMLERNVGYVERDKSLNIQSNPLILKTNGYSPSPDGSSKTDTKTVASEEKPKGNKNKKKGAEPGEPEDE